MVSTSRLLVSEAFFEAIFAHFWKGGWTVIWIMRKNTLISTGYHISISFCLKPSWCWACFPLYWADKHTLKNNRKHHTPHTVGCRKLLNHQSHYHGHLLTLYSSKGYCYLFILQPASPFHENLICFLTKIQDILHTGHSISWQKKIYAYETTSFEAK